MRSLIISTIAFIPVSIFLHRQLDTWGLDPGGTRTMLVAVLAGAAAYAIAFVADLLLA